MQELNLEDLKSIIPDLTESWSQERLEASLFCLDYNQHKSGVEMNLEGNTKKTPVLAWSTTIDQRILNTWNDVQEATEKGAEGIAALLVDKLTEYKVIRRSIKATGIDYWLGYKQDENSPLIYNDAARLEISGLINGSDIDYKKRIKNKSTQTLKSANSGLPAFVSITDFGKPRTTFKKV